MLHYIDLNMMQAMARHDPCGQPKDRYGDHRRAVTVQRRLSQRVALRVLLRAFGQTLARIVPRRRQAGRHNPTVEVAP